jgi:hypothetical protein
MTTVFLSGSRKIGRIGEEIRFRLDNMIENQLTIITGDANGADRAMQAYLAERRYENVMIYFVGEAPRNNVGQWPTKHVVGDDRLSGRDFYAQKDRAMSKIADFGFVLWDGKSSGSAQNMLWLLQEGKKAVVYFAPDKHFYNLKTQSDLIELLAKCDDEVLDELNRKVTLPDDLKKSNRHQSLLDFQS